jgi:hypothetical protein
MPNPSFLGCSWNLNPTVFVGLFCRAGNMKSILYIDLKLQSCGVTQNRDRLLTLHYTTLHYTALYYTTLHHTTLYYTILHYIILHYTTLYYTTLHYTTLHYTKLHYITLHYTILHYTTLHYSQDSSVGIAFAAGWTVWGSNPDGGEFFRTRPDRAWDPPSLLYRGYRVFHGVKAAEAWRWPLVDVKGRVELYLYTPSGPSWHVPGKDMPVHTMKACRRIKMLLHPFLTSKLDWSRKLQDPLALLTGKRQPGTHWRGAWLDNKSGTDVPKNKSLSPAENQNPVHPGHSLVVWRFRIRISTRKPAILMKYAFFFLRHSTHYHFLAHSFTTVCIQGCW